VEQCDLGSVLGAAGSERVDLVLVDVQGAETVLLERGRDLLRDGKVRFLMVATHHHLISDDALTHQRALRLLTDLGAHVVCEHSVSESYAGDGLIAVSFDSRDRDFVVEISRARSKDTLFGELEYDLAAFREQFGAAHDDAVRKQLMVDAVDAELTELKEDLAGLQGQLAEAQHDRDEVRAELTRTTQTKLWRWSRLPRQLYAVGRRRLVRR
jgi:hypothetical protein